MSAFFYFRSRIAKYEPRLKKSQSNRLNGLVMYVL
ncbi:hypothetical protein F383_14322 [Gossypium arboreum]|uniref:Uncharacterized protein n=1 Tax=Gossypium arboreum TaxID=29729 RepID=A0A0B0PT76_GOSAR|nr:hypothetical protein F383_14322 [Gossypium arboreum]